MERRRARRRHPDHRRDRVRTKGRHARGNKKKKNFPRLGKQIYPVYFLTFLEVLIVSGVSRLKSLHIYYFSM